MTKMPKTQILLSGSENQLQESPQVRTVVSGGVPPSGGVGF